MTIKDNRNVIKEYFDSDAYKNLVKEQAYASYMRQIRKGIRLDGIQAEDIQSISFTPPISVDCLDTNDPEHRILAAFFEIQVVFKTDEAKERFNKAQG